MAMRIEIDIFSGRPNPVLELTGKDANEALERVRPGQRRTKSEPGMPPEPALGYRGLRVEQVGKPAPAIPKVFRLAHGDLFDPGLAHRAADEDFEYFIRRSTGPIRNLRLGKGFPDFLQKEIERFKELRLKPPWPPPHWPKTNPRRCAPLYELSWWNDGGQKQFNNNCYNYPSNYRTNTFAQPGRAAGAMYTALICDSVKPAAPTAFDPPLEPS